MESPNITVPRRFGSGRRLLRPYEGYLKNFRLLLEDCSTPLDLRATISAAGSLRSRFFIYDLEHDMAVKMWIGLFRGPLRGASHGANLVFPRVRINAIGDSALELWSFMEIVRARRPKSIKSSWVFVREDRRWCQSIIFFALHNNFFDILTSIQIFYLTRDTFSFCSFNPLPLDNCDE